MDYFLLSKRHRFIGFFDSGAGGLNLLNECRRLMPGENYLYFADTKNSPYGSRTEPEIRALTLEAVKRMSGYGLKALVLACNTATSAAVEALRKAFYFPVIGMEPAVKPAAAAAGNKKTVLFCTPATARQEKLNKLVSIFKKEKIMVSPQKDWAGLIEGNIGNLDSIRGIIKRDVAACVDADTGALVLGCTHYIFIKDMIKETADALLGKDIPVFDGCAGTVNNLKAKLTETDALTQNKARGQLLLVTTAQTLFPYWELINLSPFSLSGSAKDPSSEPGESKRK